MIDQLNRFPPPRRRDKRDDEAPLAWCGWELPIASGWKPLHIEGAWKRGTITLGAKGDPIFKVSWWRPGDVDFNPRSWMDTRANAHGATSRTVGPANAGFSDACLIPDATDTPEKGGIWCGYSADSDLAIELDVLRGCDDVSHRDVLEDAVPRLSASGQDDPTPWAIYDASFESPAGFTLERWRLHEGDLSLSLTNGQDDTLMVRQVYLDAVAMDSRPIKTWLESTPFNERGRRKIDTHSQPVRIKLGPSMVDGMRLGGQKSLSFPLHWARRRSSVSLGTNDPRNGRLLLMQIDSRQPWPRDDEARVLSRMNWHRGMQGR